MIQSIFPSNISPCISVMVVLATKYLSASRNLRYLRYSSCCHSLPLRWDFTSQTRNNTNTADDVLEIEYFTDNYVDSVHSRVIDIANLSAIRTM